MSTQRWCPVQLHSAHASRQCQRRVGTHYRSTVTLLTAGGVNTVLVPHTAPLCSLWLVMSTQSWCPTRNSSTVLMQAGNVEATLVPHTSPQCSCQRAMQMLRCCPVQLHSALYCWQCQHSVGAPYSSTVLKTAGYVNTTLVPSTAPQCSCWQAMLQLCKQSNLQRKVNLAMPSGGT